MSNISMTLFRIMTSSDGPMIDYSRKSVGLGFRLRQSIVK